MFYILSVALISCFVGSAFINLDILINISYAIVFLLIFLGNFALKNHSLFSLLCSVFEGLVIGIFLVMPIFFGLLILLKGHLINEMSKFLILVIAYILGLGINYMLRPFVDKIKLLLEN